MPPHRPVIKSPLDGVILLFLCIFRDDVGIVPYGLTKTRQGSLPALLHNYPLSRIILNIFPNLIIILLIPDHMVIKRPLKNCCTDFLCGQYFDRPHDPGHTIVLRSSRRGRCPHRPAFQAYDHMNMIRHDHIFFNFRHIANIFFNDPSIRLRDDVGIVPYDVT